MCVSQYVAGASTVSLNWSQIRLSGSVSGGGQGFVPVDPFTVEIAVAAAGYSGLCQVTVVAVGPTVPLDGVAAVPLDDPSTAIAATANAPSGSSLFILIFPPPEWDPTISAPGSRLGSRYRYPECDRDETCAISRWLFVWAIDSSVEID